MMTAAPKVTFKPVWDDSDIAHFVMCDGSVKPAGSFDEIAAMVSRSYGGKISQAAIGPVPKNQGFIIIERNGIIAILIGLLLPAVQKVREAAARTRPDPAFTLFLKGMTPGATVAVYGANGGVWKSTNFDTYPA